MVYENLWPELEAFLVINVLFDYLMNVLFQHVSAQAHISVFRSEPTFTLVTESRRASVSPPGSAMLELTGAFSSCSPHPQRSLRPRGGAGGRLAEGGVGPRPMCDQDQV